MRADKGDKNRSVVYSFGGRWEDALRANKVKIFFRKRRPVITPDRVFFYVGVPVKAIIGFAEVKSIVSVDLVSAKKMKNEAAITDKELSEYVGNGTSVYAISVDNLRIFPRALSLEFLSDRAGFNPPQSFSKLTDDLANLLSGAVK